MREREKKHRREGDTWIGCLPALTATRTKPAAQACAPDRESNPRLYGVWANALTIEQHGPGINEYISNMNKLNFISLL